MVKSAVVLTVVAIVVVPLNEARPQSLDIGGIELTIGQDVAVATQRLALYRVVYSQESNIWSVSQRVGSDYQWLGHIEGKDGKITGISKDFVIRERDIATAYTAALRELHRRGGETCLVNNVEYSDDLYRSVETKCGAYHVSLLLPSRSDYGVSTGTVSLQVRVRR